MPKGFVYLYDVDPSIEQDMRYAGPNNFTRQPVPGYDAAECVLVREAAEALKAKLATEAEAERQQTALSKRLAALTERVTEAERQRKAADDRRAA